ncbi:MAG: hypothetical protein ACD_60C00087G0036 [uncultured bacterium]|nr:MAG: hypothetical protein ACD_60C00087G0036 [uncultured bacterium]
MKNVRMILGMVCCLMLFACSNMGRNSDVTPPAKYKVSFNFPKHQQWDLVSVEQDANGYAKSYRSLSAKGMAKDQSFYINYGHNIETPMLASMNEVVGSMSNTGCKRTHSKIVSLNKNTLVFIASADECMSGRSIWQIFKVFNMQDGQYSIVYSGNPNAVPVSTMQQMKTVVMGAKIVRI